MPSTQHCQLTGSELIAENRFLVGSCVTSNIVDKVLYLYILYLVTCRSNVTVLVEGSGVARVAGGVLPRAGEGRGSASRGRKHLAL